MTPLELKATIETLLTAEIGTYKATDTTASAPAISILFPSNQDQGDRACTGLEVVMSYAPAASRNNRSVYQMPDTQLTYKVSLIQHEIPTGIYTMTTAVDKLQRRFLNGYGSIVQVDSSSSVLAEYTFLIPDSDLIPADRAIR